MPSTPIDPAAVMRAAWRNYRADRLDRTGERYCRFVFGSFIRAAWRAAREAQIVRPAPVPVVLTVEEKRGIAFHEARIAELRPRVQYAVTDQIDLMICAHLRHISNIKAVARQRAERAHNTKLRSAA